MQHFFTFGVDAMHVVLLLIWMFKNVMHIYTRNRISQYSLKFYLNLSSFQFLIYIRSCSSKIGFLASYKTDSKFDQNKKKNDWNVRTTTFRFDEKLRTCQIIYEWICHVSDKIKKDFESVDDKLCGMLPSLT